MQRNCLLIIAALSLAVLPAHAGSGAGTTAAAFLRIDTNARPAGMGGAFCAVADDIGALSYNPAGLTQMDERQLSLSHNEWIEGIRTEYLGYAYPVNKRVVAGFSLTYLSVGGLVERDIDGEESGRTFGSEDFAAVGGLGVRLSPALSIGGSVKFISESVKDRSDSAVAFDAGALYELSSMKLGAALQNAGTSIKLGQDAYALPLALRAGIDYYAADSCDLVLDIAKGLPGPLDARFGAEWMATSYFILRAGYKVNPDANTGSGFSAGFGLSFRKYFFDYAVLPYGDFGVTHRVSLTVNLGKPTNMWKIFRFLRKI